MRLPHEGKKRADRRYVAEYKMAEMGTAHYRKCSWKSMPLVICILLVCLFDNIGERILQSNRTKSNKNNHQGGAWADRSYLATDKLGEMGSPQPPPSPPEVHADLRVINIFLHFFALQHWMKNFAEQSKN